MAVDATTFKARFPEFDSVADARIDVFLADARAELSESIWGEWYDKGLSYLTAHFLLIAETTAGGAQGSVSALSSITVGDVSESYALPTGDNDTDAYYQSTSYGQEYLRLAKQVGMGWVCVYE